MQDEKILTVSEIAEYLHIGRGTAYSIIVDNNIPVIKLSERGLRVKLSDLDKWIESKKTK